jgi:polyphenol oxidase
MPMTTVKHQAFHLIERGGVAWLECGNLSRIPWLRHAFSTRVFHRTGGRNAQPALQCASVPASLNLGYVEGEPRTWIKENRRLFFERLGAETLALASLRQIHSSVVYQVRKKWSSSLGYAPSGCTPGPTGTNSLPSGDALLTDQPGILLSVRTADCVPILLVDSARHAIAAVHAGWRGSLQRIAEKTVGEMGRAFHSQPEELLAAIGPSIRACCYEVGQEVVEAFHGRFTRCEGYFRDSRESPAGDTALALQDPSLFLSARPPGHGPDGDATVHLDLVAVTRDQLRNAGLRSANIHVADYCTACRTDLFFSHRKEGTTGRMMAVIGMV